MHHDASARLGQADGDRAADPVTGSGDEGGLPLEVDRYHGSGECVRTGELVFDVPVGMLESVERSTFTLARLAERMAVKLHVGVVLEQNVDRLVLWALELLTRQHSPVALGEVLEVVADDEAKVLEPSDTHAGGTAG